MGGKTNQEDNDSFNYVLGAILFSVVVVCVLVVICLLMTWSTKFHQVKPSSNIDAPAKSEPISASNATVAAGAEFVDEVVDCENVDHQTDSVGLPPCNKISDSNVRCDGVSDDGRKPVAFGVPCAQPFSRERKSSKPSPRRHDASLQEEPCSDDDASETWVGSAEWAAARATRKKRLSEIFATSIITGIPIKKTIEGDAQRPVIETEAPPAPLAPPPKLEVLLPCANIEDSDSITGVAEANAGVFEQLQHTASDDIALRKKQFKTLCARWHPDKNLPGNVEFTTEVFQYLQAQKTWYLD